MQRQIIVGQLVSGIGEGRHFTQLSWARKAFIDKLSIDPFPGTANLAVKDPVSLSIWVALKESSGVRVSSALDESNSCAARCYPVTLEGDVSGAIVLPEVDDYSEALIELIAEVSIRDALGIVDGDEVRVEVR